ncbi:Vga family ABC-F type ribosomal protection protein [Neobacillus sp. LXY-4]|uniref:Vga family ABC-F type ribosomal protection protein n=1 Tax=Neobacillus sp. LXY-4 TaxID=3379826 RepID=UPI003EE0911F
MAVLEANQLKIYVRDRLLLDIENIRIQKTDRIGIVGRNGCGKTTLLEVLAGKKSPETGAVLTKGVVELLPQLKKTDTVKSGGEVTQEYINDAILQNPEILLADEPTTNLDAVHIQWVEKKLLSLPGALVVVSHDRLFLDTVCTLIWEINDGKIKEYKGNYSHYLEQKELELRHHATEYEKYEKKKKQLEEALMLKEKKAEKATKKPKNVNLSEARNSKPYFANKKKKLQKSAKAIETRIEKLERIEKIKELPAIKMNLPNEVNFKGRIVLRVENVQGEISQSTLWEPVSFTVRGGDKLAIIGPNGSGKTTLVKKILARVEGISIAPAMKIGYFSQHLDILNTEQSILENVVSTSKQDETFIRTVLARLHFFREDVYKQVSVLSGGERVKVALAKLFVSEINTLVLDEPTNYLDIESVEALESLLGEYEGTVIFVSHDRRFVENLATRVLEISNKQVHLFEGSFTQYKQHVPKAVRNEKEDRLLVLETKITEVLSRLSIDPSAELENEFKKLLAEKRKLML